MSHWHSAVWSLCCKNHCWFHDQKQKLKTANLQNKRPKKAEFFEFPNIVELIVAGGAHLHVAGAWMVGNRWAQAFGRTWVHLPQHGSHSHPRRWIYQLNTNHYLFCGFFVAPCWAIRLHSPTVHPQLGQLSKLSSQVDSCSRPRMNQKTPGTEPTTYGVSGFPGGDFGRKKMSEKKKAVIPIPVELLISSRNPICKWPSLDVGHIHSAFPTSATDFGPNWSWPRAARHLQFTWPTLKKIWK